MRAVLWVFGVLACLYALGRMSPSDRAASEQPTSPTVAEGAAAPAPAPSLASVVAAAPARPDAPEIPEAERKPGQARVCFTSEEIVLKGNQAVTIPSTTIFEDHGKNDGTAEDPSTWHYESVAGQMPKAAIMTMAPITLTARSKCADVAVKMHIGPLHEAKSARAADKRFYGIHDIVAYPIPKTRPAIELGKLIDDIAVSAVLLADVTARFETPEPASEEVRAAACAEGARKLAAHVGAGIGRQGSINVQLDHKAAHSMSFTCAGIGLTNEGVFVAWDGSASPPPATRQLIARAGAFVTGAQPTEIASELAACVAAAMKPDAGEMADREFRGVKIECHAFARDGGAGAVDVFRHYGVAPGRPAPTAQQLAIVATASRALEAKEAAAVERTKAFVSWWEDPSIPKDVKVFVMLAARMLALDERCPTAKSHAQKVADMGNAAGLTIADIRPGGRYGALMLGALDAMQKDVAKTPVAEACAIAAKYD